MNRKSLRMFLGIVSCVVCVVLCVVSWVVSLCCAGLWCFLMCVTYCICQELKGLWPKGLERLVAERTVAFCIRNTSQRKACGRKPLNSVKGHNFCKRGASSSLSFSVAILVQAIFAQELSWPHSQGMTRANQDSVRRDQPNVCDP